MTTVSSINPAARLNNDLAGKSNYKSIRKEKKDFTGFILEIRTLLNERTFVTVGAVALCNKHNLYQKFILYLVNHNYLERKIVNHRNHQYRLTARFKNEVTAQNLEKLYDKCMAEEAKSVKARNTEKKNDPAIEWHKPEPAAKASVKLDLSDLVKTIDRIEKPLEDIIVGKEAEPAVNYSRVVDLKPQPEYTVNSWAVGTAAVIPMTKKLSMLWELDGQEQSVNINITGPEGSDYKEILKKSLILLDIRI